MTVTELEKKIGKIAKPYAVTVMALEFTKSKGIITEDMFFKRLEEALNRFTAQLLALFKAEAVNRVEIDEDILGMTIMGSIELLPSGGEMVKDVWTGIHCKNKGKRIAGDVIKRLKELNPLKLKEDKKE